MFQRFYNDTLITDFIKELLATTYIPTIPVVPSGVELKEYGWVDGGTYIYKNNIVKCRKEAGATFKLTTIQPYVFGRNYSGITSVFISNNSSYDSETHVQLGNYVRTLQNLSGQPFMAFYNCFNDSYAVNTHLETSEEGILIKSGDKSGYKVITVPVKFNSKYTVALDCPTRVLITSCIYPEKGFKDSNDNHAIVGGVNKQFPTGNFRAPVVIGVGGPASAQQLSEERNLRLLIQVPESTNSSIVVLEGEYRTTPTVVSSSTPPVSFLSLLQFSDNLSYAFSDRLVELILDNIIGPLDVIEQDIERVQRYVSSVACLKNTGKRYTNVYTPGYWDMSLQYFIFNLVEETTVNINKLDNIGLVSKDAERLIARG